MEVLIWTLLGLAMLYFVVRFSVAWFVRKARAK
jgi:hypothetical protein